MTTTISTSDEVISWTEITQTPSNIVFRASKNFAEWINKNPLVFSIVVCTLAITIFLMLIVLAISLRQNRRLKKKIITENDVANSAQNFLQEHVDRLQTDASNAENTIRQEHLSRDEKLLQDTLLIQRDYPLSLVISEEQDDKRENLLRILNIENTTMRDKLIGCHAIVNELLLKSKKNTLEDKIPFSHDTFKILVDFIIPDFSTDLLTKLYNDTASAIEENILKTTTLELLNLFRQLKNLKQSPGEDIIAANLNSSLIIDAVYKIVDLEQISQTDDNRYMEIYNKYLKVIQEQVQHWINDSYLTYTVRRHNFNREALKKLETKKALLETEFSKIQEEIRFLVQEEANAKLSQEEFQKNITQNSNSHPENTLPTGKINDNNAERETTHEQNEKLPGGNQQKNHTAKKRRRGRKYEFITSESSNPSSSIPDLTQQQSSRLVSIREDPLNNISVNLDTFTVGTSTEPKNDDEGDFDSPQNAHTITKPLTVESNSTENEEETNEKNARCDFDTLKEALEDLTKQDLESDEVKDIIKKINTTIENLLSITDDTNMKCNLETTKIKKKTTLIRNHQKDFLQTNDISNLKQDILRLVDLCKLSLSELQRGIFWPKSKENIDTLKEQLTNLGIQLEKKIEERVLIQQNLMTEKDEKLIRTKEERDSKVKEAAGILKSIIDILKSEPIKKYIEKDATMYKKIYETQGTKMFENQPIIVILEENIEAIENLLITDGLETIESKGIKELLSILNGTNESTISTIHIFFKKKKTTEIPEKTVLEKLYDLNCDTRVVSSQNTNANNDRIEKCYNSYVTLCRISGATTQEKYPVDEASSQALKVPVPEKEIRLKTVENLISSINKLSTDLRLIQGTEKENPWNSGFMR